MEFLVERSRFWQGIVHVCVTCLHVWRNYILAGIGEYLFIYKENKLLLKKKIFSGQRIHEVVTNEDILVILGGKQIAVLSAIVENDIFVCESICSFQSKDWVQSLIILNDYLIIGLAHNFVELWRVQDTAELYGVSYCEEKCILYSSCLVGNSINDCVLLGGTVFSEIVIWAPRLIESEETEDQPVLHRLIGHKGVIFSITVSPDCSKILSTSDDRSVRLWSTPPLSTPSVRRHFETASISLRYSLFGHTARVWKGVLLGEEALSVGEDGKACVWGREGELKRAVEAHGGAGIRGISIQRYEGGHRLITGAEDGGIVAVDLDTPALEMTRLQGVSSMEGIPRRLAILDTLTLVSTDRGEVFIAGTDKTFRSDEFRNYCLTETSHCGRFVALASLNGRVVVLNVPDLEEVFNEVVCLGRIFALHWLEELLIVTGPGGRIEVFKTRTMSKTISLELPSSKERWTTTACVFNNFLILGDRMGSVFFYDLDLDSERPCQSFLKTHGYLGVTDIVVFDSIVFSTGRDGTVKEYHFQTERFDISFIHKLPLDWSWKLVFSSTKKLVLGFSSSLFVVWSLSRRETLAKFDCGGGHRSCDYFLKGDVLDFVFIRDKIVNRVSLSLRQSSVIRQGHHAKEINCLDVLTVEPLVFVTGSEDTTLRISRFRDNELETLFVLETHISSVRALSVCYFDEREQILFAGGGRAQLTAWLYDIKTEKIRQVTSDFSKQHSTETRFMCLDSKKIGERRILLAAGCSDRKIQIFTYSNGLLLPTTEMPYTHCILKVKFVSERLISLGTDGKLVFWKLAAQPELALALQFHQSGVNALDTWFVEAQRLVVATGGDDNLLSLSLLRVPVDVNEVPVLVNRWMNTNAHSCQITGVKLVEKFMYSTSIDQRIILWSWQAGDEAVSAQILSQCFTSVADVQGLALFGSTPRGLDENRSEHPVCVFGEGLEMLGVAECSP